MLIVIPGAYSVGMAYPWIGGMNAGWDVFKVWALGLIGREKTFETRQRLSSFRVSPNLLSHVLTPTLGSRWRDIPASHSIEGSCAQHRFQLVLEFCYRHHNAIHRRQGQRGPRCACLLHLGRNLLGFSSFCMGLCSRNQRPHARASGSDDAGGPSPSK